MQKIKSGLLVGVAAAFLWSATPAQAFSTCKILGFMCFFQDPVGLAMSLLTRSWRTRTNDIHYDVKEGLRHLQSNIGSFRSEDGYGGDCGISATRNTGCHLTTPEEGAQMTAELMQQVSVIPTSTVKLINKSEKDGAISLNKDTVGETKNVILSQTGDIFDDVRANTTLLMFETDNEIVNKDCTCSAGTGKDCSTSECAQQRQNELLVMSTLGASGSADTYLTAEALADTKQRLKEVAAKWGSSKDKRVIDAVGDLGNFSIYASSAAMDMMLLMAQDLRLQSYSNLITSGIKVVDITPYTEDVDSGEKK